MTWPSLVTGAAVLTASLFIAGCGDATPKPTVTNPDVRTNAPPRSPDRAPVQDSLHSTPSDSSTRAASQDRALADNADKQAAGSKQDYNGIAKPIGDLTSGDRISASDTRAESKVVTPDAVVRDSHTTEANLSTSAPDKPRAVDNSGQNETDKHGTSVTPMDQGNSEADIAVTRTIRKALTGDSTLSVNAQNLKVITRDGVVVLRGPVASQAEADAVLGHARTAAGANRIENQIAVPTP